MIGNLLGVLIEGLWYLVMYGRWETHVVTIWGPFCLIYGIGFAVFYLAYRKLKYKNILIQFLIIALVADIVEYLCGALLFNILHMRAWNYSNDFLNLHGYISFEKTIIWGIVGVVFIKFLAPMFDKLFDKVQNHVLNKCCFILSIFMFINIAFTSVCLVRWKNRHFDIMPINNFTEFIDRKYNDDFMEERFIEWYFIK